MKSACFRGGSLRVTTLFRSSRAADLWGFRHGQNFGLEPVLVFELLCLSLFPSQDLKKYGATTVVRVCEVTYDKTPLEKDGITVVVRGVCGPGHCGYPKQGLGSRFGALHWEARASAVT